MHVYTFTTSVDLTLERCAKCRRWYGYERYAGQQCPHCACDSINALNNEIAELQRSNAALRGAVTRASRRGKAAP